MNMGCQVKKIGGCRVKFSTGVYSGGNNNHETETSTIPALFPSKHFS